MFLLFLFFVGTLCSRILISKATEHNLRDVCEFYNMMLSTHTYEQLFKGLVDGVRFFQLDSIDMHLLGLTSNEIRDLQAARRRYLDEEPTERRLDEQQHIEEPTLSSIEVSSGERHREQSTVNSIGVEERHVELPQQNEEDMVVAAHLQNVPVKQHDKKIRDEQFQEDHTDDVEQTRQNLLRLRGDMPSEQAQRSAKDVEANHLIVEVESQEAVQVGRLNSAADVSWKKDELLAVKKSWWYVPVDCVSHKYERNVKFLLRGATLTVIESIKSCDSSLVSHDPEAGVIGNLVGGLFVAAFVGMYRSVHGWDCTLLSVNYRVTWSGVCQKQFTLSLPASLLPEDSFCTQLSLKECQKEKSRCVPSYDGERRCYAVDPIHWPVSFVNDLVVTGTFSNNDLIAVDDSPKNGWGTIVIIIVFVLLAPLYCCLGDWNLRRA